MLPDSCWMEESYRGLPHWY